MSPVIEKLMSGKIYSISSERSVSDAAEEMAKREVGSLLVDRHGSYVGVISEREIIRKVVAVGVDPTSVTVGSVMTALLTVEADQTVIGANDLMKIKKVRHLAVTRKGEVIGVLSVRDLLQSFYMEPQESGTREFD